MDWQEELNAKRLKTKGWYGCAVPEGWKDIVLETDEMLAHIDPDYEIQQIKEKFGTLRYYFYSANSLSSIEGKIMYAIASAAEAKSSNLCQECGKYGETLSDRGWVATLCREHRDEGR